MENILIVVLQCNSVHGEITIKPTLEFLHFFCKGLCSIIYFVSIWLQQIVVGSIIDNVFRPIIGQQNWISDNLNKYKVPKKILWGSQMPDEFITFFSCKSFNWNNQTWCSIYSYWIIWNISTLSVWPRLHYAGDNSIF
jgi:hypothetical protein